MKLSVIVPCYNESHRLHMSAFRKFIHKYPEVKLCFVNDGSTDSTADLLDKTAAVFTCNITVIHLDKNQGKGEAVRLGMLHMMSAYPQNNLCYLDADLSTPLREVARLAERMQSQAELLCAFGSRVSIFGSQISRLNYRHYGGRLIATMIDMVLKLSIYDTQCGLKIFHPSLGKTLFESPFLTRWLFDVEIFARMKMLFPICDLKKVMQEIPVQEWVEKGNSKIRFKDLLIVPFALLSIRSRYLINTTISSPNYASPALQS